MPPASIVTLVPWLFSGLLVLVGGFLAWKVGIPAVKMAAMEQHIKLISLQQRTAMERAEFAEQRATQMGEQLAAATAELKTANMRIASLLTVIELKQDWDRRIGNQAVGTTQTTTVKTEVNTE